MNKPEPPKSLTETDSAPGWPSGTKGAILVTDAQIAAYGEAMAAWGAVQYKEDAERYRAALLQCARMAEDLKQECDSNPESRQAIRNAQYQSISTVAHIALGTIQGPAMLQESVRDKEDAERFRAIEHDFSVMSPNIDGNHYWVWRGRGYRGGNLREAIDKARKA